MWAFGMMRAVFIVNLSGCLLLRTFGLLLFRNIVVTAVMKLGAMDTQRQGRSIDAVAFTWNLETIAAAAAAAEVVFLKDHFKVTPATHLLTDTISQPQQGHRHYHSPRHSICSEHQPKLYSLPPLV